MLQYMCSFEENYNFSFFANLAGSYDEWMKLKQYTIYGYDANCSRHLECILLLFRLRETYSFACYRLL